MKRLDLLSYTWISIIKQNTSDVIGNGIANIILILNTKAYKQQTSKIVIYS